MILAAGLCCGRLLARVSAWCYETGATLFGVSDPLRVSGDRYFVLRMQFISGKCIGVLQDDRLPTADRGEDIGGLLDNILIIFNGNEYPAHDFDPHGLSCVSLAAPSAWGGSCWFC
jgi:hypothetical protein